MVLDLDKFKDIFICEAEDHLQKINDNLLKLEKKPNDSATIDELMRSAHTIKGSSATMGFVQTAFLTHVLEDVFDYARNGLLKITPKIIDKLFSAVDELGKSLESIKKSNKETIDKKISEKIKKITGVKTNGVGKSFRDKNGAPVLEKTKEKTQIAFSDSEKPKVLHSEEEISHIKVSVERIDNLMDLMEELLIDKMRLENLEDKSPELKAINDRFNRLVSNLQYQIMGMRMIPLEQIFLRFPRMVRDLSQKDKKEISLDISGGDLELDRTIVDKLGDPLVHLLRNAVDHAITKKGKITLEALRDREYALIKVEDDGQGIDWKKVVEVAVEKEIISRQESEKYFQHVRDFQEKIKIFAETNKNGLVGKEQLMIATEVVELFFKSRLSTKKEVTETSGRGVGVSIVKNFSNQANGRLVIESPIFLKKEEGKIISGGTRFSLELPFTLAMIKTLLVGLRGDVFAVPFSIVDQAVIVEKKNIKSMADQDVAVINGKNVPLVRLEKVFNIKGSEKLVGEKKDKDIVVLVRRGNDVAGIVVDELIKEQEIIVKPLPPVLLGSKGFSGSTILGDGKTVLIIDAVTLLEDVKKLTRF